MMRMRMMHKLASQVQVDMCDAKAAVGMVSAGMVAKVHF